MVAKRTDKLLYSIRVHIRHPTLPLEAITRSLGVDPTYSWSVTDPGRIETMWSLETWTEGDRYFFDEIDEVLAWFEGKGAFIHETVFSGGKITLIAQLTGRVNIGDELRPETMAKASRMGIGIGVEVFPNLQRPK